jgi:hypothetical protein
MRKTLYTAAILFPFFIGNAPALGVAGGLVWLAMRIGR